MQCWLGEPSVNKREGGARRGSNQWSVISWRGKGDLKSKGYRLNSVASIQMAGDGISTRANEGNEGEGFGTTKHTNHTKTGTVWDGHEKEGLTSQGAEGFNRRERTQPTATQKRQNMVGQNHKGGTPF
jgi:hypothetical protein